MMIKLTKSELTEEAISLNDEATKLAVISKVTHELEFTYKNDAGKSTPLSKYDIGSYIYLNALYIWQYILAYFSNVTG